MATFLGSDTTCVSDLPLIDTQIIDPKVLIGQRIARRLTTRRGALASINDDPNAGWDCRQYVNAKMTSSDVTTAQAQITNECLKDQEVQTALVQVTLSQGNIVIGIALTSAEGPFSLTLNVGQLTTDLVFSF